MPHWKRTESYIGIELGVTLGLSRYDGKENGNYYNGLGITFSSLALIDDLRVDLCKRIRSAIVVVSIFFSTIPK